VEPESDLKGYAPKAKAAASAAPSAEEDAARDLISAVKAGDAKAASLALKRHYELCSEPEDDEDTEV
jgi:hypothetical protein